MDTMLLRVFQLHLFDQCRFFLMGVNDMQQDTVAGDQLWYGLQNALIAAANISKLLWGQAGKLSTEREALRLSVDVSDQSPLQGLDMRNHWEHFDERLDHWWAKSKRHNYIDQNLMARDAVSGADDIDMFRLFDPSTGEVWFWGDRLSLKDLVEEVQRILPIVQREAAKPHED